MWVAQVRRDGLFIKKIKEDMMSVGGRKVEVDLERVKGRVVGKYDQNTLYEILKGYRTGNKRERQEIQRKGEG